MRSRFARGSAGKMRKGGFVIACEVKPEIRFVRAIDQNKTSSLGTVTAAATTTVVLSEAIRWANANLTLHTPLSRTRSDNSWIFEHPADSPIASSLVDSAAAMFNPRRKPSRNFLRQGESESPARYTDSYTERGNNFWTFATTRHVTINSLLYTFT